MFISPSTNLTNVSLTVEILSGGAARARLTMAVKASAGARNPGTYSVTSDIEQVLTRADTLNTTLHACFHPSDLATSLSNGTVNVYARQVRS
jgi:hypothetical protein